MRSVFVSLAFWFASAAQLCAQIAPPVTIDDRPKAPPVHIDDSVLTYDQGRDKAIKEGKPLVTFLAHPSYAVEGAVVCYADTLPGYTGKVTIVSVPRDGQLWWKATLPLGTSTERIRTAFAVDPFRQFVQARPAYAQGWDCGPSG